MRASAFLLLLAVFCSGCGDDSVGDGDRDGATEENADGGDGDGDGDGDAGGDGDGDGDAGGDGDGDGDGDDIVSAMIGAEGGTITSSDGKLTLNIPEGALEDDELISIELLPKGESQALLADADELVSYRFEPDGLQFNEPVELAVELADLIAPAGEQAVVPLVFASVYADSENTVSFLERQELAVDLDSGDGVFTTEIEHFSAYSFEAWEPNNKLNTAFFYFEVSPLPPPEMELNKDYGLGLYFHTRRFLAEPLPLTYDDLSEGLVYSEGADPFVIGSIPGEEDQPTDYVIDAGDYACSELGAAQYEARLTSETFIPPAIPRDECESATEDAKCLSLEPPPPVTYRVRLTRDVQCIPEETTNPEPDGAPFSGFVRHRRTLDGTLRELSGAFYDGGADQAKFDAYVAAQRRQLGIMPDRGADGTCRAVDYELYLPYHEYMPIDIDLSHVAAGADDMIGLDFVSPPTDPLLTAPFDNVMGLYRGGIIYNQAFTDQGVDIYVPANAPEPAIRLPGWDEEMGYPPSIVPGNLLRPFMGDDIMVTWQANEVGGELIHVWGYGFDASDDRVAFECFASVEDQLVTIPAATIVGLFPATPTEPLYVKITVESGSHTTAVRDGKTLDGYNILRYYGYEDTTPIDG